jgi:sulfate transport system substrate-binding protein
VNPAFVAEWKKKSGESITINQSHGGSSKQARSVIDGLAASVVTMNQANDIDILAEKGLVPQDWAKSFPNNCAILFDHGIPDAQRESKTHRQLG